MWKTIVSILFRYRLVNVIVIVLLTAFMAYKAMNVQLSYELARMLPWTNKTSIEYENFKQMFGEDGNVFVAGIQNDKMYELNNFNGWYDAAEKIKSLDGIEEIVTITRSLNVVKNEKTKKFDFIKIVQKRPVSQIEVDSIKKVLTSLPFYKGILYNPKTNVYLMAITLDKNKINDKSRYELQNQIEDIINTYCAKNKLEAHYSGLPYIRTVITEMLKNELKQFIIISLIIAAIILIVFFNSLNAVLSSLVVVVLSVIWALGTMSLFGYKITILTAVLPSLLIMIAIENCIYVLNKYHIEYKNHGNQMKALTRVIQRIGFATLMTNVTTATGFATFIFTSNTILKEFGIVASINVMIEFLLTFALIPIIFSYAAPPKEKHIRHLDNKIIKGIIEKLINIIVYRRPLIYFTGLGIVVICLYGVTKMHTSGKITDDIPSSNKVYKDLKFFESNFGGVMPFEISIDTKKKNGVLKLAVIQKIEKLENRLKKLPEFAKPLSLAQLIKFSKQAFYHGKEEKYTLPDDMEKDFILSYFPSKIRGKKNIMHSFIDSTKQYTRISVQVADVGMKEMNRLQKSLKPQIDSIFSPEKYNVIMTGNSIVYAKGTEFLVGNLLESVLIGVAIISLIMALVFTSPRIILIAIIVNIIPLIITAAIMGFAWIPVKPSTLIVFSIALGISIDNAILYLSKYRFELSLCGGDIKIAAINSLRETGISMIYTSVVFVFGFGIFIISGFGGTQALGFLISITLFVALFFNILVLPTLLLSIDKRMKNGKVLKPIIDITEENNNE
jgi:uncharacterized protein